MGSAMTHHPHAHMIVPGGGGVAGWQQPPDLMQAALLPARACSFKAVPASLLEKLAVAHATGKLTFFGAHAHLTDTQAFALFLAALRKTRWFVYAKRPFAGPKPVLAADAIGTGHRCRPVTPAGSAGVFFSVVL
jgi:hypothetical protein